MSRHPKARRIWPWVVLLLVGLLTTTGPAWDTRLAGWLMMLGAAAMIIRRRRGTATAPGDGYGSQQPATRQPVARRPAARRPAARRRGRSQMARHIRLLIRLLP